MNKAEDDGVGVAGVGGDVVKIGRWSKGDVRERNKLEEDFAAVLKVVGSIALGMPLN